MSRSDFIWPTLEVIEDAEKIRLAEKRKQDLEMIRTAVIDHDAEILIEEARRLADLENDRRKTAETKAAIYLTFVGVLSPILATIAPEALNPRDGWAKLIATLALFLLAGAYLLRCGAWAFQAIAVRSSAHPDAVELVGFWSSSDRKAELAKDLLKCARLNRQGVNDKVTAIKMAHEFATRAFLTFILALLIRAAWAPLATVLAAIANLVG